MSKSTIDASAAKLAGLQIDTLTKYREGQLSVDHWTRFLNLSPEAREERFGDLKRENSFSTNATSADPWAVEKKRIEKFYKKFFNRKVDWSLISMPAKKDDMNRLEVVFSDITEDQIFAAYAKKFGANAVWKYYGSITDSIREQQARPDGDYAFCHVGGDEADMLGKSYDDGIAAGIKFMIPKEGLIAAFRHRVETTKMYDTKGLTRFAALDTDGCAMRMGRYDNGQFGFGGDGRGSRDPDYGLRQVSF